jgi:signal transduction histidine kinase
MDEADSRSQRVSKLLHESGRIAELNTEINAALIQEGDLQRLLRDCADIMVRRLNIAFARLWTSSDGENLVLQAASGLLLPTDKKYSRITVGKHLVGRIAKKRTPHVSNDLLNDPGFAEKAWIRRERMRSFAGFPLIVEERLVGVMCAFSREPMSELTLQATKSISMAIAGAILRKQTEAAKLQLAERLEESRESERRRLSRHLHDEVAQQLAVASIKLSRLENKVLEKFPDESSIISDLVVAQELIHKNQQSLRQIAHTLHPGVLEHFGLVEALRRFVAGVKDLAAEQRTVILFERQLDFPRLGLAVETGIYRIAQEAVKNALRHAQASQVSLTIGTDDVNAFLIVRDNGRGFDPDKGRKEGIGLESMRERAEIMGGELTIKSTGGKGTVVTIRVPVF